MVWIGDRLVCISKPKLDRFYLKMDRFGGVDFHIWKVKMLKNTECKFGPGGQADHLLSVKMIPGEDTRFRDDPISVEGTLIIKPFQGPDGNTWSIYDLTCERVTRYQTRR